MTSRSAVQSRLFSMMAALLPVEAHQPFYLAADPFHPAGHHLRLIQRAFVAPPGRIPNEPRGAPKQQNGPMAMGLKAPQGEQRHQVADMQAVCGGVEPAVDGAGTAIQVLGQSPPGPTPAPGDPRADPVLRAARLPLAGTPRESKTRTISNRL